MKILKTRLKNRAGTIFRHAANLKRIAFYRGNWRATVLGRCIVGNRKAAIIRYRGISGAAIVRTA